MPRYTPRLLLASAFPLAHEPAHPCPCLGTRVGARPLKWNSLALALWQITARETTGTELEGPETWKARFIELCGTLEDGLPQRLGADFQAILKLIDTLDHIAPSAGWRRPVLANALLLQEYRAVVERLPPGPAGGETSPRPDAPSLSAHEVAHARQAMRYASAAYGHLFMRALGLLPIVDLASLPSLPSLSSAGHVLSDLKQTYDTVVAAQARGGSAQRRDNGDNGGDGGDGGDGGPAPQADGGPAPPKIGTMDARAVLTHTGAEVLQQANSNFNDAKRPGHYVAVHHGLGHIVVAFRGTSSMNDVVTDLLCDNVPYTWPGSTAHDGMAHAARSLFDDLSPLILGLHRQHPGYRLVVTGHSLGAGVATLFAATILSELAATHPGLAARCECHAFAPPPVLSGNVPAHVRAAITAYVVGQDCVPRLCFRNGCDLVADLKWMDTAEWTAMQCHRLLTANTTQYDWHGEGGLGPREESAGGDAFRDTLASHAQLGVVGRTIHIVRPGGGAPGAVCASEVAPAAFSRIELASNMFSDHLPHVYEKAMDDLVAAAHGGAEG